MLSKQGDTRGDPRRIEADQAHMRSAAPVDHGGRTSRSGDLVHVEKFFARNLGDLTCARPRCRAGSGREEPYAEHLRG
jgi:hypothetical protein